jgi:ATP-dependent Clp protease ATP-binding subunit ClpA
VFDRFTERARRVVVSAVEQARAFGHDHVGTEHILLGLLGDRNAITARALASAGVAPDEVRSEVLRTLGVEDQRSGGQIPFTARAKRTLQLAPGEAAGLRQTHVGPEALLLALLSHDADVAIDVLTRCGGDPQQIRDETRRLAAASDATDEATGPGRPRERSRPPTSTRQTTNPDPSDPGPPLPVTVGKVDAQLLTAILLRDHAVAKWLAERGVDHTDVERAFPGSTW